MTPIRSVGVIIVCSLIGLVLTYKLQQMVHDEFVEAVDQQLSDDPRRGLVGLNTLDAVENEFDKAIAAHTEVIKRDPKAAQGYIDRGDVYLLKGDAERALADYEEAVRLEPNNAAALSRRDATRADQDEPRNLAPARSADAGKGKGTARLKVIEGRSLKQASQTEP